MKVVLNVLKNIGIGIWVIVAIFVTVCLLSYNEYNVPVIGSNSLLIIDNDELEPDFKEGDLAIVKRNSDKKIEIGDKVFYYNGNKTNEFLINIGEVTDKETVTSTETTFELHQERVSSEFVVGEVNDTKTIAHMGTFLGIFTSQWGFMFLVILPTLFALVYEIVYIVGEVKKTQKES